MVTPSALEIVQTFHNELIIQNGIEPLDSIPQKELALAYLASSDLFNNNGYINLNIVNSAQAFVGRYTRKGGNKGELSLEIGTQSDVIKRLMKFLPWTRIMGDLLAPIEPRLISQFEQLYYTSAMYNLGNLLEIHAGRLIPRPQLDQQSLSAQYLTTSAVPQ